MYLPYFKMSRCKKKKKVKKTDGNKTEKNKSRKTIGIRWKFQGGVCAVIEPRTWSSPEREYFVFPKCFLLPFQRGSSFEDAQFFELLHEYKSQGQRSVHFVTKIYHKSVQQN